ncbi:hypothetical protein [Pseudomonas sp. EMN2]|uniref:hypothetical protein n=1 Tax=Pseudomonas sp. EMN2 TaxID=2615212 RepID=UPI00129B5512|nr:hypothetical protein [Pseudomonas sp. EMN2]
MYNPPSVGFLLAGAGVGVQAETAHYDERGGTMEQSNFGVALEAAYKDGYEEGFRDRDNSGGRDAGAAWKHWITEDGQQFARQAAADAPNEDSLFSKAVSKLRVAMTPLRNAYTHAARVDALNRVDGMLLMLKVIDVIDADTVQRLVQEIRDADSAGASRTEAKSASGVVSRCMRDDVIHARADALMSLQDALDKVRQASNKGDLEHSCFEVERQLMNAFPAYVDEDELVEWRVSIVTAKSQRIEQLV